MKFKIVFFFLFITGNVIGLLTIITINYTSKNNVVIKS